MLETYHDIDVPFTIISWCVLWGIYILLAMHHSDRKREEQLRERRLRNRRLRRRNYRN